MKHDLDNDNDPNSNFWVLQSMCMRKKVQSTFAEEICVYPRKKDTKMKLYYVN